MKPILYEVTESAYQNNGIGILNDAISCKVSQEANGAYVLDMLYPISGIHYEEIRLQRQLLAKVDTASELQPFRIKKITRPMNGRVSVYAEHISYDLSGIPLMPYTAQGAAAAVTGLKTYEAVESNFDFWTDKETSAAFSVPVPMSVRAAIGGQAGSILDVYGGELEFDRFSVKLYNRRGQDNGVRIRYGKNLTSLTQEENCASVYTGVYPYWSGENVVFSLPEKIIYAEGTFARQNILALDLTADFETQPTEEQLRSRAQAYMTANNIGVPAVSLSFSFAQFEQTQEYAGKAILERVELFDTVTVEFPALAVTATARCVKTVYDSILERYEKNELGSIRANIADTIAANRQEANEKLNQAKTALEAGISNATNWITNGEGYVVIRRNAEGRAQEILIMDTPNINTAVKVWRWNQGGLGYSRNGYAGNYELAMTQDGAIVADFITVGILTANIIKTGILQSGDGTTFHLDLDNGTLKLDGTGGGGVEILNAGITVTNTQIFETTDYTQEDVTRIQDILLGNATPTAEEVQKYDIYGSGEIELLDLLAVQKIVTAGQNLTVQWNAQLDTSKRNILKVWRQNSGADDTEMVVFNATAGGVKMKLAEPLSIADGGTEADNVDDARKNLGLPPMAGATSVVTAEREVPLSLEDGQVAYIGYVTGSRANKYIYFKVNGNAPDVASYSFPGVENLQTGVFAHAGSDGTNAGTFTGWLSVHYGVTELWGEGRRNDGTRGSVYMAWNTDEVTGITISESGRLNATRIF